MEDKSIFRNGNAGLMLICALALVAVSWFRAYMAGTIMVDGHGLGGWAAVLVFVSILVSLGLFSLGYYRLWLDSKMEIEQVKVFAFVLAHVFTFMLPLLSNDIFSYLVFGDAVNKGADVYTNAQCTHFSSFYHYITGIWTTSTCAYGPVVLLLAMLATWIAAGKIMLALAIYKIMVLVFALVFIEVAARICSVLKAPVACFTFIVLNPVLLLQGVGQLHADLVAITFVIIGIYMLLTDSWQLAFLFAALSIATKMNYVLVIPFFLVWPLLQKSYIRKEWLSRAAPGSAIVVMTFGVSYLPFFTSMATFTTPFSFHYFQNPSKCIGEIFSYIIYFFMNIFKGNDNAFDLAKHGHGGPGQQVLISMVIVKICQVFALISSLYILWKFSKSERTVVQWFRVYVRALLLFLLFYLHIFNPWYLMLFLPFMWADEEPGFMLWVFVLTCFISVQDVVCTMNRDTVVYAAELVLTFISVLLYMYKPRRMFFTSLKF